VEFVCAAGGDTESAVKQYMSQNSYTWPNGIDQGNQIARLYKVKGYPTTVFIDKQGNEKSRYVGYLDQSGFEKGIKAIL